MWYKLDHATLAKMGYRQISTELSKMGTKMVITWLRPTDGEIKEIVYHVGKKGQPTRRIDELYIPGEMGWYV